MQKDTWKIVLFHIKGNLRFVFEYIVQLSDSKRLHNRKPWQQVNNCSLLPSQCWVSCSRTSSLARLFLPGKFGKFCRLRRSQQRTTCGDKQSRGHLAHKPPTRVILNNHLLPWACSSLFLVVTGNTGQRCFWTIPSHAFLYASWTNIMALIQFLLFNLNFKLSSKLYSWYTITAVWNNHHIHLISRVYFLCNLVC